MPILLVIVDQFVGPANFSTYLEFPVGTGGSDDLGPERCVAYSQPRQGEGAGKVTFGNLNTRQTYAARSSVNKAPLPCISAM